MTRRKPPSVVELGPYSIDVRFDHVAMTAATANGAYLADTSTVLLQDVNSLGVEQDTVVHELLHAAWKLSGLNAKWPDDESDSEGEAIINVIAPRILELLRRNPDLVRYLVS